MSIWSKLRVLVVGMCLVATPEISSAQATRDKCTCDLDTAGDRQDGGEVGNAAACFLTVDDNINWCTFDVEALKNSAGHQQLLMVLRNSALDRESLDFIRQLLERYLFSEDVAERLQTRFSMSPDDVAGLVKERLGQNGDLLDACLQSFAMREPGKFVKMAEGDGFACGVDEQTGWLNLEFRFDGWTLIYLTEPSDG